MPTAAQTDYDRRVRTAFDLGRLEYQRHQAIIPLIALYEAIAIGQHFEEAWWRSLPESTIQCAMTQVFDYWMGDQPSLTSPPCPAPHNDETLRDTTEAPAIDTEQIIGQMYQMLRWIWTCDVASLQVAAEIQYELHRRNIPFDPEELLSQHKRVIEEPWSLFPDPLLNLFLSFVRKYPHQDYSLPIAFLLVHIGYRTTKPYAPPLLFATTAARFKGDYAWRTLNALPIEDWKTFTLRWLARTASLTERNIDDWIRDHQRLQDMLRTTKHPRKHAQSMLDLLVQSPVINTQFVSRHLEIPPASSTYNLVSYFEDMGIIMPVDNRTHYRIYVAPALSRGILRGEIECIDDE